MYSPAIRGSAAAVSVALLLLSLPGGATIARAQNGSGSGSDQADAAYFKAYHATPRDTVTQTVYDGFKQFALNCARCHGDFGVGTSFAPALVESVKPAGTIPTPEMFLQVVCVGRTDKGMPAWCAAGLEMTAIQQIYAYLVDRSSGKVGLGRPAVRTD